MIPINDLQRIDPDLLSNIKQAVNNCFSKGWYLLGPETQAFEQEFAAYCNVQYCLGVANGTDALEIALRALNIQAGDEVATVANAGMYSTIAINSIGASPLYIEIDPSTNNMSLSALKKQTLKNTKAIIVTHLYGQLGDIKNITTFAKANNIPVIEDCAQAHGAMLNHKKAGTYGDVACFSFYPTKNLGAMGDAGAIITNNAQLAHTISQLRQYGWQKKYHATLSGGRNSRIDEIQATVLRIKLKYLDGWNAQRREIAKIYSDHFQNLGIQVPTLFDDSYVAHLYVIQTTQREELREHLANHHVHSEVHYPVPDYLQSSANNNLRVNLIHTEKSCNEVLTLPCFPDLSEQEIHTVINAVTTFFKK